MVADDVGRCPEHRLSLRCGLIQRFIMAGHEHRAVEERGTDDEGQCHECVDDCACQQGGAITDSMHRQQHQDRKSTRLNSSHVSISYAVFCLKKKTTN